MERWIPVSEDLPKLKDDMSRISDDVLATDGVDMFVAYYYKYYDWEEWKSTDSNYYRGLPIIAWMPLPKPYESENEEQIC